MTLVKTIITNTQSAEQDLGAVTWSGGSAPSGTITKKYYWNQVGKLVTITWRISATVAGSGNNIAFATLPADLPLPKLFSTASTPEFTNYFGSGSLLSAFTNTPQSGFSALYNPSPGVFHLYIRGDVAGTASTGAVGTLTYIAV